MKSRLKPAGRHVALTSSTALTAVISLSAVISFAPQVAAQDARDYIHDDGNVTWSVNDSFADDWIIGLENTGVTASIKDGAKVSVGRRAIIAGLGGSQATVTVSGAGSELNVVRSSMIPGNTLTIGGGCNGYSATCVTGGDGTLIIESGGKVDAKTVLMGDGQQSSGKLLVTGPGSVLSADYLGALAWAANPSSITIEKSGSVLTQTTSIGKHAPTDGQTRILINGNGSHWINTGHFDLEGLLRVEDGGTLRTNTLALDDDAELLVTGENSSLTASDGVLVEGNSHLVVANGANVDGGSAINVGKDGYLVVGGQVNTDGLSGVPEAVNTVAAGRVDPKTIINFSSTGTGRLVFNHTNSAYLFSNKLTGDGSIVSLAGETVLSGDLTGFASYDSYEGGVIVDGGSKLTLKGDLGTAITGGSNTSPGTTAFRVKNGTLTIGGETGQIVSNFLGNEVYSSRVDIWGDTQNAARQTTGAYGTLAGSGTVGSTTVDGGGTISPGDADNPLGKITVRGALAFQDGSIYAVDVAGNGQSDTIAVEMLKQYAGIDNDGNVKLVDGLGTTTIGENTSVQVTALDDATSYQTGQSYTILTSAGGITGTFKDAISKSAFLDVALDQQEKAIDLKIAVKNGGTQPPVDPGPPVTPEPPVIEPPITPEPPVIPELPVTPPTNPGAPTNPETGLFDSVAESSNQVAVARSLNTLQQSGESLALYNRLLLLSADEARSAFNQLSGEAHASAKSGLITSSGITRDVLNGRMRSASGAVAAQSGPVLNYWDDGRWAKDDPTAAILKGSREPAWSAWGQVFGSWSDINGQSGVAGTDVSTGGFITGIDRLVGEDTRLGLFAGYSRSSFKVNDRTSSTDSDNYHLGLYGGTEWGALAFRSGISYTLHELSSTRSVNFPGVSQTLTSDYDAGAFQAYGELGYTIDLTGAALEPFVNLAHVSLHSNGFSETGGSAALTMGSDTTNTTFTTLGLRGSSNFVLGAMPAVASGTIGWRHAYGDTDPASRLAFAGSDSYTIRGSSVSQDAFLLQLGLAMDIAENTTLGINYNGEFGGDGTVNAVDAKLNVRF